MFKRPDPLFFSIAAGITGALALGLLFAVVVLVWMVQR